MCVCHKKNLNFSSLANPLRSSPVFVQSVVVLCLYSLFVSFHSQTLLSFHRTTATPVLSPSSSSTCPTCLMIAVMKNQRRRIFLRFSLGPGTCANVCCMLQRAAWPLTAVRRAQHRHSNAQKNTLDVVWMGNQHFSHFFVDGILSIP